MKLNNTVLKNGSRTIDHYKLRYLAVNFKRMIDRNISKNPPQRKVSRR
jgi:hypothetical protein